MAISELSILSQGAIAGLSSHNALTLLNDQVHHLSPILAQHIDKVDILADIQHSFQNFIKSGQVWALGIGFVLGYLFCNFSKY